MRRCQKSKSHPWDEHFDSNSAQFKSSKAVPKGKQCFSPKKGKDEEKTYLAAIEVVVDIEFIFFERIGKIGIGRDCIFEPIVGIQ